MHVLMEDSDQQLDDNWAQDKGHDIFIQKDELAIVRQEHSVQALLVCL